MPSTESAMLYVEKINFLSPIIGMWTHGILFSVAILCIHTLLITKRSPLARRWFHVGYVCLLFILGTCGGAANVAILVDGFVYNREFPGGPIAYLAAHSNSPFRITGFSVFVVATWLQDGYLLYRFMIIYQFRMYAYAVPALMFLASIACSCVLLVVLGIKSDVNTWNESSIDFATPYWALSISLNVMLTFLIVIRILWVRRLNSKTPGGRSDKLYTTAATLLIESAALYSIVGVIYLALYSTGNTVQAIPLAILGEVQCISPMLIIYRVAKGAEWSPDSTRRTPFDSTRPYTLSTVRTTHLAAPGQESAITDTHSSEGIESIGMEGMKQTNSYSEHAHIV